MENYYSFVELHLPYYQDFWNGFRPFNGDQVNDAQWAARGPHECQEVCKRDRWCAMRNGPERQQDCEFSCDSWCRSNPIPEPNLVPSGVAGSQDWRGQSVVYPILPIPGLRRPLYDWDF
jgi:hypothetical protein